MTKQERKCGEDHFPKLVKHDTEENVNDFICTECGMKWQNYAEDGTSPNQPY